MRISFRFMAVSLFFALFVGGCETVQVDSSSAGTHQLTSLNKCYVSPNFADSDGSKPPSEKFDERARMAISSVLTEKGYTIVDSAAAADFIVSGSWQKGKILASKQPTAAIGGSTQASAGNGYYLTLTAMTGSESLWSVISPLTGGTLPDEIAVILKDFPAQGGS